MMDKILDSRDMSFLLYEFLDTELLINRLRYAGHSREIFNATLESVELVAKKYFANHYSKGDANEPSFDGMNVKQIPETKMAWDAVSDLGIMSAHQDFDEGGMQLPYVICASANAYLSAANASTAGYHFLTIAACNVIRSFANDEQKSLFVPPMMDGRFAGTMALTEPNQGSALADIKTVAYPHDDGSFRIKGQKMFITNGDHSLSDNIVHLVLAKIKDAPAGVNGISLFIVPKIKLKADGSLGEANDVALAGLLHKMGYRNATSTVLNFGEKEGAEGYLIGKPHRGLHYMFQMMNEARIGVGTGAAALAYQGYLHSLAYARERPQGRLPADKSPNSKQVNIIEHADVRRMLLTQKAYAEGAMALCLYATSLMEDERTADTECERQRAAVLLDLLTPVVKSWPSKYGCLSNDLAIQVLGGSGYIREYPLEQLYRDQRLNPIHEGTEGIHGLDLLGRKIPMQNQYGFDIFKQEVRITLQRASLIDELAELFDPIHEALERLDTVTAILTRKVEKEPNSGLANATVYLDMFGRVVMAWIWLRQALVAYHALNKGEAVIDASERGFYQGKLQAARFYIQWDLSATVQQSLLLEENNLVCFEMQDGWF